MKIRFIGHSGFYVELEEMNLLFDYYRGDLPEIDRSKPLFVFVSHAHPDHFQREIFSLAEKADNVVYFLSDDIRRSALPLQIQESVRLLAPETETEICRLVQDETGRELRQEVFLTVNTYRSTDEGVAFLIDCDEARIYHAGDLNDWHWEENTEAENNVQRTLYLEELRELRAEVERSGRLPDIAFVPVDSRLGENYWLGADAYMREVGARYLVPMHLNGDKTVIRKLRERSEARDYRDQILGTGEEGEVFSL